MKRLRAALVLGAAIGAALAAAALSASAAAAMPASTPLSSPSILPPCSPTPTPTTGPTPIPSPTTPCSPTPSPSPSPSPSPTATPTPPTIVLSISSGPPGTQLTVTGNYFDSGAPVAIFMDRPDVQIGQAVATSAGNVNADVTVPNTVSTGSHIICISAGVQPPCAQFEVLAPSPSPTQTPSPSPSPTPPPAATPKSGGGGLLGALFSFPFLAFPLGLLVLALGGAIYFVIRSRRSATLPPAAVVTHRSGPPGPRGPGGPGGPAGPPPPSPGG